MSKSRFTEEQMVTILREADQTTVAEAAKKHTVSEPTIYAWRKHFGQMEASDAKRLKTLEQENARLKKLLAEAALDIEVLKEINAKMYGPPRVCKALGSGSVCRAFSSRSSRHTNCVRRWRNEGLRRGSRRAADTESSAIDPNRLPCSGVTHWMAALHQLTMVRRAPGRGISTAC